MHIFHKQVPLAFMLVAGLRHGSPRIPADIINNNGSLTVEEACKRLSCAKNELMNAVDSSSGRLEVSLDGTHIRATGKHTIARVLNYFADTERRKAANQSQHGGSR